MTPLSLVTSSVAVYPLRQYPRASANVTGDGLPEAPKSGAGGWPRQSINWLRVASATSSLRGPWWQRSVAYVGALLLAGAAATTSYLLTKELPGFAFPAVLSCVAIALISIMWGLLPALSASLISAVLIHYFVLSPQVAWKLTRSADVIGIVVAFAALCGVSIATSLAVGRYRVLIASQARRIKEEEERANTAETLARQRNDLLAMVSHELRTPLTAIVGYAQLLEGRWAVLTDEQKRHHLDDIVSAAMRQRRLVEDLLLAGRLDSDMLRMDMATVALGPLVVRATEEVGGTYTDQVFEIAGEPDVGVLADPGRVTQILTNLVDNAAKYSPQGSPVQIAWERDGGRVLLWVRDCGQGIPVEGAQHLFDRFGRLPGSHARAGHMGTGLGLYLSRLLARAMGGDVDLELTGPTGSTFRLQLTAAPAVPHGAPDKVTGAQPDGSLG